MEGSQNDKNWRIGFSVLWLVALLVLTALSSCGLFRKVDKSKSSYEVKSSVDSSRISTDSLNVITNTVIEAVEVSSSQEFLGTKIYPKGPFTYSNGVFQGEADSIITNKQKDSTKQTNTNTNQQQVTNHTKEEQVAVSADLEEKGKSKEVHKKPDIPSWFWYSFVGVIILTFYLVHKLRP